MRLYINIFGGRGHGKLFLGWHGKIFRGMGGKVNFVEVGWQNFEGWGGTKRNLRGRHG